MYRVFHGQISYYLKDCKYYLALKSHLNIALNVKECAQINSISTVFADVRLQLQVAAERAALNHRCDGMVHTHAHQVLQTVSSFIL